ncbi:hypothetical protein [Algibacter sp. PT7-4]|uniref:hypothetical protein n=1 Tax=Algibacter ulvanivorans TaxID=3400999 RepID=UPI003AAF8A9D
MKNATLDLTQNAKLTLLIDEGVSYQPSISGLNILDTEYALQINNKTYTVANGGLILEAQTKSIVINILETDFTKGNYTGNLISNSRQAGIYFNLKIYIECYGNNN